MVAVIGGVTVPRYVPVGGSSARGPGEHGEQLLSAGRLSCPAGCGAALRPHGHGRARTLRGPGSVRITVTPRRARCRGCRQTHVLVPAGFVARRADTIEVIGVALVAKARGAGARRIAAQPGRPVTTVRRWLRGTEDSHADWLYRRGLETAMRIEPDLLSGTRAAQPCRLATALNLLAGAALAYRTRLSLTEPPWTLIGFLTGGRLLAGTAYLSTRPSRVTHAPNRASP